jgi:dUTP pyrophosphatase
LAKIKVINQRCKPERKRNTDAGHDLRIKKSVMIPPHTTILVPAGFKVQLDEDEAGIIHARSSVFKKGVVIDGVIDSSYTGEVGIMMTNTNNTSIRFSQYERVAQLVITKINNNDLEEVDELEETERGEDGFGSSGKH